MNLESWFKYRRRRTRSLLITRCSTSVRAISAYWSQEWRITSRNWVGCPRSLAADAGFYSSAKEQAVQEIGVQYISIPHRSTPSKGATTTPKAALVQKWAEGTYQMRGSHQRAEAASWISTLPIPRP